MSGVVLPVLHREFDAPLVLMPLASILAGCSGDGIDFSLLGQPEGESRTGYGPQEKRDEYAEGWGRYSTGGARTWDEWLDILATDGIRNPVSWYMKTRMLGNGHHRVIGAYDLGWTHIPVSLIGPGHRTWSYGRSLADGPTPEWTGNRRDRELVNA